MLRFDFSVGVVRDGTGWTLHAELPDGRHVSCDFTTTPPVADEATARGLATEMVLRAWAAGELGPRTKG